MKKRERKRTTPKFERSNFQSPQEYLAALGRGRITKTEVKKTDFDKLAKKLTAEKR
jgi:hypothetical protein